MLRHGFEEYGFYTPMPDGFRFVNADTGEVHECFDRCTRSVEWGDRIVCPLSKAVLGMSENVRAPTKKRVRDRVDEVKSRTDRERESRRSVGFGVIGVVFQNAPLSDAKKARCVERAMDMYDWLNEKIPFDAMMYAFLICASDGVDTPAVHIERDDEIAPYVRPLRCVGQPPLSIKQNAVTKAYTAIMNKRGGVVRVSF